jgi:hypothetical protein
LMRDVRAHHTPGEAWPPMSRTARSPAASWALRGDQQPAFWAQCKRRPAKLGTASLTTSESDGFGWRS